MIPSRQIYRCTPSRRTTGQALIARGNPSADATKTFAEITLVVREMKCARGFTINRKITVPFARDINFIGRRAAPRNRVVVVARVRARAHARYFSRFREVSTFSRDATARQYRRDKAAAVGIDLTLVTTRSRIPEKIYARIYERISVYASDSRACVCVLRARCSSIDSSRSDIDCSPGESDRGISRFHGTHNTRIIPASARAPARSRGPSFISLRAVPRRGISRREALTPAMTDKGEARMV